MDNMNQFGYDPKVYEEILKQFDKIKLESGIEPDDEYQKELEDLLGIDFEDLDEQINLNAKTKIVEVELVHEDAVFPKYAIPVRFRI
jgi:hypothetical protein